MITIDHMHFEIIENYRDAFDEEQFQEKYSEVLNKYDYIVGDIGYEKLRLAGFFRDNKAKAERDKKFSAVQDYLYEYCNFGCAYFILRKVPKSEMKEMREGSEHEAEPEESGHGEPAGSADTSESGPDAQQAPTDGAAPEDRTEQPEPETEVQPQKRKKSSRGRKKPNQQKQNDRPATSNKTLAAHQSFKNS